MDLGGGGLQCGQVHGELDALSGAFALSEGGVSDASHAVSGSVMLNAWIVSPTVGKFLVIMPSAVQVSRLRKSLSESLVTYTSCRLSRVAPDGDLPENLRRTAPMILIRVVHGVHLHGDWDQISLTQAKATDNLYAS